MLCARRRLIGPKTGTTSLLCWEPLRRLVGARALLILLDDSVHKRGPSKEEHGPRARDDGTAIAIHQAIHVRDHARRGSHGTHAMRPCCGTRSRDPQASAACMWFIQREFALSTHVWPMPCTFCVSQRLHAPWLRARALPVRSCAPWMHPVC